MSSSTLKPAAIGIHPASRERVSPSKVSTVKMINSQPRPFLQVTEKEKTGLQESFSGTSRREMMQLTAASVGLLSLLLPPSAEARTRNASIRQKIMEKLEALREKAGFSKPKDGQGKKPKDEVESKSKIQDSAKESKPDHKDAKTTHEKSVETPAKEPSVPALPSIINGKAVEATLP